jgi:uncharacterized protein YbcI
MESEHARAPADPIGGEHRVQMLRRIANEMATQQKREFGKGPQSTHAYLFADLLQVVMRDCLTTAEHTMLSMGEDVAVRSFRQTYQDHMATTLRERIEDATGRRVINFMSQIMFNPDIVIQTYVFDRSDGHDFVAAMLEHDA